jgi:ribosomal protein S27E
MARQTGPNPDHPAVAWDSVREGVGGSYVDVTCPDCDACRPELAKIVRNRIKSGIFTGRCRRDAHRSAIPRPLSVAHSAVDWTSSFIADHAEWVPVTCPVCREKRNLAAKSVRNQIKRGRFTGLCQRDRLVGKVRSDSPSQPSSPFVDWSDVELVREKGSVERRRTMIRVHCPECSVVRLVSPTYLRLLIRAQAPSPHRRSQDGGHARTSRRPSTTQRDRSIPSRTRRANLGVRVRARYSFPRT